MERAFTKSERRKVLPLWYKTIGPILIVSPLVLAFWLYFHSHISNSLVVGVGSFILLHTPIFIYLILEIKSVEWLKANGYLSDDD